MPVEINELTELCCTVCDNAKLQVCVKESLKGGAIAGTFTVLGGVLAGPAGLAVGGAIGGATAAYLARGKFESVSSILRNLDNDSKQKLYDKVISLFTHLTIEDVASLQALLVGDPLMTQQVVEVVVRHLEPQFKITVCD